jgi:hypothetical protein
MSYAEADWDCWPERVSHPQSSEWPFGRPETITA